MENPPHRHILWTGRVLSALPILLLAFSALMKFKGGPDLEKGFEHLGLPLSMQMPLAILETFVVLAYAIPKTSVQGAILITGYMGGAILTHWRIGEPVFMQVGLALVAWLGLYLREPRLPSLLPFRK